MTISTRLTEQLNIRVPIVLAPMAGVSGGALAKAVSDAGGFGFVGAGYLETEELLHQLSLTGGARFGVGFLTWRVLQDSTALEAVLARKPEAVFLSFGDAGSIAPRIRKSGAHLSMQVQSLDGAREAARLGADLIVVQGTEAGGHGSARALGPLLDEIIKENLGPLVVAAGGITSGRGLGASLVRGASGALIGTAFYPAEESLAHPAAKRRAIGISGDGTYRSDLFDVARGLSWPEGWTLRAAENAFSKRWHDTSDFSAASLQERSDFKEAVAGGDFDTAPVIVGEGIGMVERIEPAADILSRIELEAESALRGAAQLLR